MKKLTLSKLTLALGCLVAMTGCDDLPTIRSPRQVMFREWKAKTVRVKAGNGTGFVLVYTANSSRNLEDYFRYRLTFFADSSYALIDQFGVATQGKPQWRLVDNDTRLLLNPGTPQQLTARVVGQPSLDEFTLLFTQTSQKVGNIERELTLIPAFN